jgi:hypothetical protein
MCFAYKMKLGEKITILFCVLIAADIVYASQNANITLFDSRGLCLRENLCQTCDNQTLSLDGTSDHMIYLEPEHIYDNCMTEAQEQTQVKNITHGLVDIKNIKTYLYFGFMVFMGGFLIWTIKH